MHYSFSYCQVLRVIYIFWISLLFVFSVRFGISAPIIAFTPLSTAILIILTWKYTVIEYEYIIVGGTFCLTKIYGKKKRKAILEADIKNAKLIAPYTDDYVKKAEDLSPENIIWAVSSQYSENIWMFIFLDDEDRITLVFFEADDRSIRFLMRANPRATVRINS